MYTYIWNKFKIYSTDTKIKVTLKPKQTHILLRWLNKNKKYLSFALWKVWPTHAPHVNEFYCVCAAKASTSFYYFSYWVSMYLLGRQMGIRPQEFCFQNFLPLFLHLRWSSATTQSNSENAVGSKPSICQYFRQQGNQWWVTL